MNTVKSDVLIAIYVVNKRYINYVPIFLYSAHKAYPKYDLKVFIDDSIPPNISDCIEMLDFKTSIEIDSEHKHLISKNKKELINASRWLGFEESDFDGYKYVYLFPDVDFFCVKYENNPIEQRIQYIELNDLPYVNNLRDSTIRPFCMRGGKMFIKTKQYFNATSKTISKLKEEILIDEEAVLYISNCRIDGYRGDEQLIYKIIKESNLPIVNYQTPDLGIHIGITRQKKDNDIISIDKDFKLQYIDCFENDPVFNKILYNLDELNFLEYNYIYNMFKKSLNYGD